jgi:hypothetical protein
MLAVKGNYFVETSSCFVPAHFKEDLSTFVFKKTTDCEITQEVYQKNYLSRFNRRNTNCKRQVA